MWFFLARHLFSSLTTAIAINSTQAAPPTIFCSIRISAVRGHARMIIRNGTVVTATESRSADVRIEGELIKEIGANLQGASGEKIIDATGMLVIPGGIDVHTHLDMPFGGTTSSDDFETGTKAAAFGGATTLMDFAIQPK